MPRIRWVAFPIVALLFVILPVAVWGQSAPALLNGTVDDPTGAVVPGAQVTLTEIDKGVAHRVSTGPEGLYSFPQVPPGAYELKVVATDFKEYVQKGIKLNMNDKFRVD